MKFLFLTFLALSVDLSECDSNKIDTKLDLEAWFGITDTELNAECSKADVHTRLANARVDTNKIHKIIGGIPKEVLRHTKFTDKEFLPRAKNQCMTNTQIDPLITSAANKALPCAKKEKLDQINKTAKSKICNYTRARK
ncbi:uncharacterized protein LOC117175113 isoform X2 [Belonocnema kinseyi]|uniref:uncharacterized protein LOC117175113 isoform X2 n=1 Tax=Belonocnema kinseyi TaxID=2817044 RepID=UPI00143DD3A0|nr:uncharacterized protein LOC117175113 isoform X2 [Belonocnema kinseyi]